MFFMKRYALSRDARGVGRASNLVIPTEWESQGYYAHDFADGVLTLHQRFTGVSFPWSEQFPEDTTFVITDNHSEAAAAIASLAGDFHQQLALAFAQHSGKKRLLEKQQQQQQQQQSSTPVETPPKQGKKASAVAGKAPGLLKLTPLGESLAAKASSSKLSASQVTARMSRKK